MITYKDKDTGEKCVWYEMREIRFTRAQVKFLLENLPSLRLGLYPRRPSGYEVTEQHTRSAGNAKFTKPVELAAEIEVRLQMCSWDGLLVEAYYCNEMPIIRMMYYCDQSEVEVWNRIGRAIRYCSGWARKRYSYREFVNHRKEE